MESLTRLVLVIALPIIGIVIVSKVMGWNLHTNLLNGFSNRLRAFASRGQQQGGRRRRRRWHNQGQQQNRVQQPPQNPPPQNRPPQQQQLPAWRRYKWHQWKQIGKKQKLAAWFVENLMGSFVDLLVWSWLFSWWVSCTFVYKPLWNYIVSPAFRWIGEQMARARPVL